MTFHSRDQIKRARVICKYLFSAFNERMELLMKVKLDQLPQFPVWKALHTHWGQQQAGQDRITFGGGARLFS